MMVMDYIVVDRVKGENNEVLPIGRMEAPRQ